MRDFHRPNMVRTVGRSLDTASDTFGPDDQFGDTNTEFWQYVLLLLARDMVVLYNANEIRERHRRRTLNC
jgi:hypothetical protein